MYIEFVDIMGDIVRVQEMKATCSNKETEDLIQVFIDTFDFPHYVPFEEEFIVRNYIEIFGGKILEIGETDFNPNTVY
jgi:hypothetical protein